MVSIFKENEKISKCGQKQSCSDCGSAELKYYNCYVPLNGDEVLIICQPAGSDIVLIMI